MRDALEALKKFHYEWKICGPYQLRCRNTPYDIIPKGEQVKFGLQIFSLRPKEHEEKVPTIHYLCNIQLYLVDLKLLEGGTFAFFSICTKLLKEIPH